MIGERQLNRVAREHDGPPQLLMYVITTLGWGGAESQVIDLAVRFAARDWKVAVVSLLAHAERRAVLEEHGIAVSTLGMRRGVPDPRALVRLARRVREFRPDIVHAHMVHANLLTRATRRMAPMPVLISTAHNVNEGARWRSVAYRLTDHLTDLTTNVSAAAVQRSVALGAAPATRIRYVRNGIDLSRFHSDGATRLRMREALRVGSRFIWLAVGRFDPQKDYPILVDAFRRVAAHPARPLLLIAGDGPLRREVEAAVAQAGLQDDVQFLGVRDDVPALLNAADAFVLSSAWEGMGLVLAEAAATRLPLVSTGVGVARELICGAGVGGYLARPRDSSALAAAMKAMLDAPPEERRAMGDSARARVLELFELESVVDEWESIYRDLFERARLAIRA